MPSIRDKSTVEAIAVAFTSNGRKQEAAMLAVGYSKAYANSYCGKLWEDNRIIQAIARIDNANNKINIATRSQRQAFWTEIYNDQTKNMADRLRASELLGRSEADFVDVHQTKGDDAPTMSDVELAQAKLIAQNLLRKQA